MLTIRKVSALILLLTSMTVLAAGGDDPLLTNLMIDRFEIQQTQGSDPVVLEGQAWVGKDINKFWVTVDVDDLGGETEALELQFLASKAIDVYWDATVGWRHDHVSGANRDWLAFGVQGLAPYFFDVAVLGFVGQGGQAAIRMEAEYEILFTQKLIMTPSVEVNVHSKNDMSAGVGSGLSDIELGLRLRYEIKREFAPYIGVNWIRKYGNTADLATLAGEDKADIQFVLGIKAWF